MKVSKRGVYYDLKSSPYNYFYPEFGLLFYFSSAYRKQIFLDELQRIEKKLQAFNEKMGSPAAITLTEKAFLLAYDKAQPQNKLIEKG